MLETRKEEERGLDNQDSTTVCKRAPPAVSKQEEVACAPCGLGAGGGGGGAQGPWLGRPGDEEEEVEEEVMEEEVEEEALEGSQKAESRGCLSRRASLTWVGAWPLARGSLAPRLPLQ